jgi:hypothetical protein
MSSEERADTHIAIGISVKCNQNFRVMESANVKND